MKILRRLLFLATLFGIYQESYCAQQFQVDNQRRLFQVVAQLNNQQQQRYSIGTPLNSQNQSLSGFRVDPLMDRSWQSNTNYRYSRPIGKQREYPSQQNQNQSQSFDIPSETLGGMENVPDFIRQHHEYSQNAASANSSQASSFSLMQEKQLNDAFNNVKKIFSGEKHANAQDIVLANKVFERMRQAVEAGQEIGIAQEQLQNITNEAGIDYSVYEFKTQDNQTILVRVLKDENATLNKQENTKFIGSVYSYANKSLSMVYAKNGEYIEIPLNANLLSRFSQTNRNLFLNPNRDDLTHVEISNIHNAVSVVLDFIPIVNTIKSTVEVVAGVDYITGQQLTLTERGFAALGTMPVIGWVKKGSKLFKGVSKFKLVVKENKIVSLAKRGLPKIKDATDEVAKRRLVKVLDHLVDKTKDNVAVDKQFNSQEVVKRILDQLVKNGERIGDKGVRENIRELPGEEKEAKAFYDKIVEEAGLTDFVKKTKTRDGNVDLYVAEKPDFGKITYRPISKTGEKSPTIEFNIPEIKPIVEKIKFKK